MCKQDKRKRSHVVSWALALTLWLALSPPGMAKDLDALAQAVIPAYTAMNIGLFCNQYDPQFLAQTGGPRGNAVNYAEHVKDEAIASLSYVEASNVLKAAAYAAREIARMNVRKLNIPGDEKATAETYVAWCNAEGRRFVKGTIEQHDRDHEALLEVLKRAQR